MTQLTKEKIEECDKCFEKYRSPFAHLCKTTHVWQVTETLNLESFAKKTLLNRLKWWIATKTFLPGSYKWIKK